MAHNKGYTFYQENFREPRLEGASQLSFADIRNWKNAFLTLILDTVIPGLNRYASKRRVVVCKIRLEKLPKSLFMYAIFTHSGLHKK